MKEQLATAATLDTEFIDTVREEEQPRCYGSARINVDQRKSYRYPAQPGCDEATLRMQKRTTKCKLTEESAGGASILVPKEFPIAVGDEIQLGIYSGWYRVRAMHVHPDEHGNRVGLQRIAAISFDGTQQKPCKHESGGGEFVRRILMTVFIAGAAMAAGGVVVNWLQTGELGFGEQKKSPARISANVGGGQMTDILNSVNVLNEPEVAKRLRLSREQQRSLDNVFESAAQRLNTLHEQTKGQSPQVWAEQSQAVVNDALANILCSLTDEQIARWREILIEQRQSGQNQ